MIEKRFTVRIKPLLGESLFSFMTRLSSANGISIYTLWNIVKVRENKRLRHDKISLINISPKSVIDSKRLGLLSGLCEKYILTMSSYYVLKRFSTSIHGSNAKFVPEKVRDRFYYCPKCMNEKPYHKLLWSISDIEICTLHKVALNNKCTHCNREIILKDIFELDICPYCNKHLSNCYSLPYNDEKELKWQYWLFNAYKEVLVPCDKYFSPPDIALKVVYILNKRNPEYNKCIVEKGLENKQIVANLLQRIRETREYRRVMHLSFILKILYKNNLTVKEFLSIEVPDSFLDSLRKDKTNDMISEANCLAPWCINYKEKGGLIKTGSQYGKNRCGNISRWYMVCPKCGCEYAYNNNDELYERTYFIKAYNVLKEKAESGWTIKSLSMKLILKKEGVYRCLAYFNSRQLISNLYDRHNIVFDIELFNKFICAVKSGERIIKIRKWSIWRDYYHFLFYRYHIDVITEINRSHCNKGEKKKINRDTSSLIENVLQKFLEQDIDITLVNICKEVHLCDETLRKNGFNLVIAKAKDEQKKIRILKLINKILLKAKEYLIINKDEIITANDLYLYLGIGGGILRKCGQELMTNLIELRKNHNKQISKSRALLEDA